MSNVRSIVAGAVIVSAFLLSVPQVLASPLVPVVPVLPQPQSRGQRAVASANEDFQAIAVVSIGDIIGEFAEAEDALGTLQASHHVEKDARRVAQRAVKAMKVHLSEGRKELKAAYTAAKRHVQEVGGSANDLDDLKMHYENQLRYLNEYGGSFASTIKAIASSIHL